MGTARGPGGEEEEEEEETGSSPGTYLHAHVVAATLSGSEPNNVVGRKGLSGFSTCADRPAREISRVWMADGRLWKPFAEVWAHFYAFHGLLSFPDEKQRRSTPGNIALPPSTKPMGRGFLVAAGRGTSLFGTKHYVLGKVLVAFALRH